MTDDTSSAQRSGPPPLRWTLALTALALVGGAVGSELGRQLSARQAAGRAAEDEGALSRVDVGKFVSESVTLVDEDGDRRGYFGPVPSGVALNMYKAGGVEQESVGLLVTDAGEVEATAASEHGGFRLGVHESDGVTMQALDGTGRARVMVRLVDERLAVQVLDEHGKVVEERAFD